MQHDVILASQPYGLGLNETLLPQYLKELGYATHAVGKVIDHNNLKILLNNFTEALPSFTSLVAETTWWEKRECKLPSTTVLLTLGNATS